jgi:holo-[acyl-carrier protein] synthase
MLLDFIPFFHSTGILNKRWCVKESAYKALYPAIRPTWKDFTFRSLGEQGEKPVLEYNPAGKEITLGNIHVSASHDGEYVFTAVIIEGSDPR